MHQVSVSAALVLAAQVVLGTALHAQSEPYRTPTYEDQGPARLTVCNRGDRNLTVALGVVDLDPDAPGLTVSAWTNVNAGTCGAVYDATSTAFVPPSAYLAFAYVDQQGRFTPASPAAPPDIGEWAYNTTPMTLRYPTGHGPALTRAARRLCVNQGAIEYKIPTNANPDCASLRPPGVSGALVPIVAQYLFHPSARRCTRNADYEVWNCSGGMYYLDVAPRAGSLALGATHSSNHPDESVARTATPEENARELAQSARLANAVAQAIVSGRDPVAAATGHEPSPWDEVRPQFWQTPIQSVGAFKPSWMGTVVSLRGTIARVNEKPAMFTTIAFKEVTGNTFVLCATYTNFLKRTLDIDLQSLVGKVLEFTGQVEQMSDCGASADIRALEPEQLRLVKR